MQDEAVNPAADPALETPTNEEVTPDYNDPNYDETKEVAPSEEPPSAEEPTVEEPPVEGEPPPTEPSPRYEKRIRQLSAKVKELNTSQPAVTPAPQPVAQPQFQPQVTPRQLPEGDYTPEEINRFVQAEAVRTGQALASIEVQQLRAELAAKDEVSAVQTQYNNDLHAVETKYPELNEDSPNFDPQLAQVVTETYEEALLANPKTASLTKIAERFMGLQSRTATKSAAAAAKAVATQRSQGAPSSTAGGPTKTASKWTPEAVAALSVEDYATHEAEIKRDLYGS